MDQFESYLIEQLSYWRNVYLEEVGDDEASKAVRYTANTVISELIEALSEYQKTKACCA